MATTFEAEVTALTNVTIGAPGAPVDTQVDLWCTEGAKDIINRIKKSAPETMPLYATVSTMIDDIPDTYIGVTANGIGVDMLYFSAALHTYSVGDWVRMTNCSAGIVEFENVVAQISNYNFAAGSSFRLTGINSTTTFTGETCDITAPDDSQLMNIPFESGIVLDVSRESAFASNRKACEKINEKEYYLSNETDGLNFRSKFNPAYYYDGKSVFVTPPPNQAVGERMHVRAVIYPTIDSGTDNIGEVVDFDIAKQHLIAVYGAIKTLEFIIATVDPSSTLGEFTSSLSLPSPPSIPTYSFSDASLGADPGSLLAVGSLSGTPPTYNSGSVVGFSTALQDFAAFHSSAFTMDLTAFGSLPPVSVPEPSGSLFASVIGPMASSASASDIVTKVNALIPPTYTPQSGVVPAWTFNASPDFSGITAPDLAAGITAPATAAKTAYAAAVTAIGTLAIPSPWNEQGDTEVDPSSSTPGYEETVGVSWEAVNDALENEDFEEASAHMGKLTARVSNQQQMFTHAMDEYSKGLAEIEKSNELENKEVWATELVEWKEEIEVYKMEVANIYTTYGHDLTRETSKWINTTTQNMTLFGQEMTDSINIFNAENAAFEKDVEAIITDIKNEIEVASKNLDVEKEVAVQNSIASYKSGLDQYMQDIANYSGSVTKYSRDVQFYVEKYNSEFQSYSDTWKTRQQFLVEENKNLVAEAVNLFNNENVAYQAEVTLSMARFNSEAEALIKKMEVSTDLNNQNKAKTLEADIQKYNAIMDRYVGEIQSYQHEVAYEIQAYSHEIAKEQQDQASIQLEYTWYQDKYNRLVGEYEAAFGQGAPAPPQGA